MEAAPTGWKQGRERHWAEGAGCEMMMGRQPQRRTSHPANVPTQVTQPPTHEQAQSACQLPCPQTGRSPILLLACITLVKTTTLTPPLFTHPKAHPYLLPPPPLQRCCPIHGPPIYQQRHPSSRSRKFVVRVVKLGPHPPPPPPPLRLALPHTLRFMPKTGPISPIQPSRIFHHLTSLWSGRNIFPQIISASLPCFDLY